MRLAGGFNRRSAPEKPSKLIGESTKSECQKPAGTAVLAKTQCPKKALAKRLVTGSSQPQLSERIPTVLPEYPSREF
jgi:hypothetical protein